MYIKIPVKKNHLLQIKEIQIQELTDRQIEISVNIFESKINTLYDKVRECFKKNKLEEVRDLNFKIVFKEKILCELYEEQVFRKGDLPIIFNKLFKDIYEAQTDDVGVLKFPKYEGTCPNDDFKSINMLKNRKQ